MTWRMVLRVPGVPMPPVNRRSSAPGVSGIHNGRARGCHRGLPSLASHFVFVLKVSSAGARLDGHLAEEAASARLTARDQPASGDLGSLHGGLPRRPFRAVQRRTLHDIVQRCFGWGGPLGGRRRRLSAIVRVIEGGKLHRGKERDVHVLEVFPVTRGPCQESGLASAWQEAQPWATSGLAIFSSMMRCSVK